MTLHLVTALRSVAGPNHPSNQDSVGCSEEYAFVADGVGGHARGDIASWTVAHRLMSALAATGSRGLDADELRRRLAEANAEIGMRARRDPALRGMSTTFTGLFCTDDAMRVVHVGDSRAYLVRDGEGVRITRDDSLVQRLVEDGALDEEEATHHPMRNVILRCLSGSRDDVDDTSVRLVDVRAGDRWLVTSDGLTDTVPEADVIRILVEARDVEQAADALVAAAAPDAHDDVSIAVCDVVVGEPDGRPYRVLGAAAAEELGPVADLSR